MKKGGLPLLIVHLLMIYLSLVTAQRAVIVNTRAVAGTQHTLTCMIENFNSTGIPLLYMWWKANQNISTCTSEQCVIPDVQFIDARTDYRCEVRRHDDNTVIAISDDTSLEVSIPPSKLLLQDNMQDIYVGSNVSYRCFLSYHNIRNIAVDISITGPGIDQNSDRVFLGGVNQRTDNFGNIDFERRLEFNPISSQDTGSYHCNATVTSAEPNPLVMSRMEETTKNIQVFRPTISISLNAMFDRLLDVAPYNSLCFICSAVITIRGTPVNPNRVFSWQRTIGESSSDISTEFFTGSQSSTSGSSGLSINATEAGIHTYTCTVTLDLSPAPDIITNSSSQNVNIIGPSIPAMPTGLSASFVSNMTIVVWLIPSITYDPETYRVQYGLSKSNLNFNSSIVFIDSSTLVGRVELTDLMVNTIYFYRVIARNSAGTTSSAISSFNTGSVASSTTVDSTTSITSIKTAHMTAITMTTPPLAIIIGVSVPVTLIVLVGISVCIIVTVICCKTKKITKEITIHHNTKLEMIESNSPYNRHTPMKHSVTDFTRENSIHLKDEKTDTILRSFHQSNLLIPGRHIQLINAIGQGAFGLVYRSFLSGWHGRSASEIVAVKTLKSFFSEKDIKDLLSESQKMMSFDHPNVMNLIGVCTDMGETPYIVMPFMTNGSLLEFLKKKRSNFVVAEDAESEMIQDSQQKLLSMCLQVAKGMRYLAAKKFIHRDLAARNCMIDDQFVIKVGDFGLSEEIYSRNYFRQDIGGQDSSVRLPVKWMALESLLDRIFSEKTDVWSYGVTCWEIFSLGHTPYPTIHPADLIEFLQSGERLKKPVNASCTSKIFNLLTQCWNESPKKRPTFEDVVREIDSLLEGVSGYLQFSAFSGE